MATSDTSETQKITQQTQEIVEEEKESVEEAKMEVEQPNDQSKDAKRWRAKLYQLNTDGGWDDLGTGY